MNAIKNLWATPNNQLQPQDHPNYPYLLRPNSPSPPSFSLTLASQSEVSTITERAERLKVNSGVMADSAPAVSAPAKAPSACVCTGACGVCGGARRVAVDESLPAHRVQQYLGTINPPIVDWPLYLLPFLFFLVNLAMVLIGYYALGLVRDITSEAEERLDIIYSLPKKVIAGLIALGSFGLFIAIFQFLVNPYSPWRKWNPHGIIAGLFVIHFIWGCCELAFLAGVVRKATVAFPGIKYLYTVLGLLGADTVLFLVYAAWPGNPLAFQRIKNAPFGPTASLSAMLDDALYVPREPKKKPTVAIPLEDLAAPPLQTRDLEANQRAPPHQVLRPQNYDPDAIEPLPPMPPRALLHPTRAVSQLPDNQAPSAGNPRPLKNARRGYFSTQRYDPGE